MLQSANRDGVFVQRTTVGEAMTDYPDEVVERVAKKLMRFYAIHLKQPDGYDDHPQAMNDLARYLLSIVGPLVESLRTLTLFPCQDCGADDKAKEALASSALKELGL